MSCKSCQSLHQSEFAGEICIHFVGPKTLSKPTVWTFPQLLVCLECGFVEFLISDAELAQLKSGNGPVQVRASAK